MRKWAFITWSVSVLFYWFIATVLCCTQVIWINSNIICFRFCSNSKTHFEIPVFKCKFLELFSISLLQFTRNFWGFTRNSLAYLQKKIGKKQNLKRILNTLCTFVHCAYEWWRGWMLMLWFHLCLILYLLFFPSLNMESRTHFIMQDILFISCFYFVH